MATIAAQNIDKPSGSTEFARIQQRKWIGLTTGDVGSPVALCNHADRSVRVSGDFGGDATVEIQGYVGDLDDASVADDDNWLPLTDQSDNYLQITAAKLEAVAQMAVYIRPKVTGGTSPSINVYLVVKE